jgi:hypothetical protein
VVAPHETFYHLRWDESLGGSHKRWLEVTASSLIEVLTKAQDLVEETCASIQAQVEADANRQARWLARRETINS